MSSKQLESSNNWPRWWNFMISVQMTALAPSHSIVTTSRRTGNFEPFESENENSRYSFRSYFTMAEDIDLFWGGWWCWRRIYEQGRQRARRKDWAILIPLTAGNWLVPADGGFAPVAVTVASRSFRSTITQFCICGRVAFCDRPSAIKSGM